MNLRLLTTVAAAGLLVLALAWFAGAFETRIEPGRVAAPTSAADAGIWVPVRALERPRLEIATGTVRAGYEASIQARITATVLEAPVGAGTSVDRGDLLFVLDARDLEARAAQAREALAAADARVADAGRTAVRMTELLGRGAVTVAEKDSADAALAVARADQEAAREALTEARTALSWARIEAPLTARLVDRFVDPGDLVMPGVPMARLYDPERLRLEADVRESLARRLRDLPTLAVHVDALDRTVTGRVEEIVPSADPGSRTFVVKVGLPADAALFPGMFGRLAIPVGTETLLLVPAAAVRRVGQLEFVDVRAGDRVARRHVRTGPAAGDDLLEIRTGLAAGEEVRVPAAAE
ncbi:MAG: efflux RND transporter periplasmic adaptor subunit [Pseudomonadales bacterium]|jgi:RND family efflux transporter MFP subunit|nr:efflux RND transporter periplasmic adaptor subunit [Pseudomonadales bacterium]